MAALRQLKLNLLADTTDFQAGIKRATGETQSFQAKLKNSAKAMAKSFAFAGAAVGAAALRIGVDAVQAALADQKAQRRLSVALKNTTGATAKQVKQVEKYITKTSLATGITDDELRPAFQRLVQSTKKVSEAQDLMNLALDISAGTGKSVETVANSLGKAYGGNLASLQRLGIGLDQSIIKSKDTKRAFEVLATTFSGQSSAAANSLEGRFARLKVAFDETKEEIGYALLPIMEKLSTWLTDTGVPAIQGFVDAIIGKDGKGLTGAGEAGYNAGKRIKDGLKYIIDHKDDFKAFAMAWATWWATTKAIAGASAILNTLKLIRGAMLTTTAVSATAATAEAAATGGASLVAALPAIAAIAAYFGIKAFDYTAAKPLTPQQQRQKMGQNKGYLPGLNPGASTSTGTTYTPQGSQGYLPGLNPGATAPRNFRGEPTVTNVINLNGIVDAESARRSIENLLQQSSLRTGTVRLAGYSI